MGNKCYTKNLLMALLSNLLSMVALDAGLRKFHLDSLL